MMRKLSSIYKTFISKFRSSYVFQEKEAYESEDSREIERLYAYIKAEQEEREKKMVKVEEKYEKETVKTIPKKQIPLKVPRKTSVVTEKSKKSNEMFDEETVESEELIERKGRRRRALSEIPLKTCFMDICEPEICCTGNANNNIIVLIEFVLVITLL